MLHTGTQTIETERLVLRRLAISDAQQMYANWACDKEVTAFLTWQPHTSVEDTQQILADWSQAYEQINFYQWGIELKATQTLVGTISVVSQNEGCESMQLGYCIGKQWWHKGITSEAVAAVIVFLFNQVKALRIEARHDTNNPHSGAVMRKCGLQYEGVLRQADRNNKGIVDVAIYGILKSDNETLQ